MDVHELADALDRAGVDPSRYVLVPLLREPLLWELRREGVVWLSHQFSGWHVVSGGIAPHYDVSGALCTFTTEEHACEVFLREMTGPGEPFAAQKAWFGAECVRQWWEDEVRIALEEPQVGRQRARWRETWRERELLGQELMTVGELEEALVAAGVRREVLQLEGLDETDVPREGGHFVLGRDERGRWHWGKWDSHSSGLLWLYHRFETEGEACQSLYHECTGPITMPPQLSRAQWLLQKSVVLDNQTAAREYDERLLRERQEQPPRTAAHLGGWLSSRGVPPERYWVSGMTYRQAEPDAVCLILDEVTGQWRVEGELRAGRREVLRSFASEAEALEVFRCELTRADGVPFGGEPPASTA